VVFPSPPPRGAAGELLGLSVEVGVSGESMPSSGFPGGGGARLSVFEMTMDLHCLLCLGAVGNGLKFCTLGADQCSFMMHSKKVPTEVGALCIASGRKSAFAWHSIKVVLLLSEQCSAVLAEKHTREEWMYLFHMWNNQAGSSPADTGILGICGIVSAIKPSIQTHLEESLGISMNLNFSDYSVVENVEDDQGNLEEAAPDLVFLSSSSSDKTQEERLVDIIQSWDSLVQTIKALSASFRSIQKKQSHVTESMDERTSTLESMVGKCVDHHLREDYITVWDAFSFLQ